MAEWFIIAASPRITTKGVCNTKYNGVSHLPSEMAQDCNYLANQHKNAGNKASSAVITPICFPLYVKVHIYQALSVTDNKTKE